MTTRQRLCTLAHRLRQLHARVQPASEAMMGGGKLGALASLAALRASVSRRTAVEVDDEEHEEPVADGSLEVALDECERFVVALEARFEAQRAELREQYQHALQVARDTSAAQQERVVRELRKEHKRAAHALRKRVKQWKTQAEVLRAERDELQERVFEAEGLASRATAEASAATERAEQALQLQVQVEKELQQLRERTHVEHEFRSHAFAEESQAALLAMRESAEKVLGELQQRHKAQIARIRQLHERQLTQREIAWGERLQVTEKQLGEAEHEVVWLQEDLRLLKLQLGSKHCAKCAATRHVLDVQTSSFRQAYERELGHVQGESERRIRELKEEHAKQVEALAGDMKYTVEYLMQPAGGDNARTQLHRRLDETRLHLFGADDSASSSSSSASSASNLQL